MISGTKLRFFFEKTSSLANKISFQTNIFCKNNNKGNHIAVDAARPYLQFGRTEYQGGKRLLE